MDVLNDLSLHKQYQFDCLESGSELKNWDNFWGLSIFKQASTILPVAVPCSSTLEASSRTGSPNESLLSEAVFKQDVLSPSNTKKSGAASTVRPLSCQPLITKCSKRGRNPATSNALKKELESLRGDSLLDELVYSSVSPFLMDHSLKMNLGHVYIGNDNGDTVVKDQLYNSSSSKQSCEDGKLPYYVQGDTSSKQSLEDGSELTYAYAKSPLEDSTSENSTSNNVFGSSEILHPVMFDQSTLEYATHGLQTWFEDPFLNTGGLQNYADDVNFIKKEEPMMANDEEECLSYGYNRSEAAHSQGFLAHTECQQGNSSILVAVNEGMEAPPLDHHLRIDFEDNFVQLPNLGQDGNSSAKISGCTQFCPPNPIFGALHSNNTMQKLHVSDDGGLHGSFAIYTGAAAENKPLSNYTDGRQLNGMYEDTSMKSCKSCVSEGSKAPKSAEMEDRLDVCKTVEGGLWVLNAGDVFSKFDARTKNKYTDLGLVRILTGGAEAVARRDMKSAQVMLARLKSSVSSLSNAMQRVFGYFIEGFEHQIEGAKRVDYASSNIKSQGDILAAFQILHEIFPYIKFGHFTANQAILEAVQGAKRVQIVDFEIMEGIQWPAFMQALVSRKGGPPELHITALCRPHWEHGLAMVQKTGKRLSEFASTLGLSFSFSLLTMEHDEAFDASKLKHVNGEALVVNCMVHLPHMPRRSMTSVASFLQGMRELSPTVITLVAEELGCNTTAAASYFSEALSHFHAICDSLEACLPTHVEARMLVEKVFMAPRIDSAVAMWSWAMPAGSGHGTEPSSRYKWSTVMHSAGFKPLPLSFHSQSQAKLLLGLHRDGFCLEERSHYLVLGWQSKPLFAASVWN